MGGTGMVDFQQRSADALDKHNKKQSQ